MSFFAGLASSIIPLLIKKAPSVLAKLADVAQDVIGGVGSDLIGKENYGRASQLAGDIGRDYYKRRTGRDLSNIQSDAQDIARQYARRYEDNYIGNSSTAINAGLVRQSRLNSRYIPRIYPAMVDSQGQGSFNNASLSETPTQLIQMYETPGTPLRPRMRN